MLVHINAIHSRPVTASACIGAASATPWHGVGATGSAQAAHSREQQPTHHVVRQQGGFTRHSRQHVGHVGDVCQAQTRARLRGGVGGGGEGARQCEDVQAALSEKRMALKYDPDRKLTDGQPQPCVLNIGSLMACRKVEHSRARQHDGVARVLLSNSKQSVSAVLRWRVWSCSLIPTPTVTM